MNQKSPLGQSKVQAVLSRVLLGTRRIRKYDLAELILDVAERGGVDLLRLAYTQRGILKYRSLEESGEAHFIEHVLRDLVPASPILFDVGANCGSYSIALRQSFPSANITAFEPNSEVYPSLVDRLSRSGVECVNLGLSDEPGEMELFLRSSNRQTSHASVYQGVLADLHAYSDVEKISVGLTTLDQYCQEKEIERIDFLKIDTEGHELAVLRGAKALLEQNRIGCIQFEFNEMNVISRVWLRDFHDLLAGFVLFRLNTNRMQRLEPYHPREEIFQFQNIVAIPRDRAASL